MAAEQTNTTFSSFGESRSNNLDLIRLLLALLVLFSHSFPVIDGNSSREPLYYLTGGALSLGGISVYSFFILSGFLITQSATRCNSILEFGVRRFLRIAPALYLLMLLTCLALCINHSLGGTHWSFGKLFQKLLLSLVLLRSLEVGDVFLLQPFPGVINASLWTIQYEACCYFFAIPLILTGTLTHRNPARLGYWGIVLGLAVACRLNQSYLPSLPQKLPDPSQLALFLIYFAIGGIAFVVRSRIRKSWALFAVCLFCAAAAVPKLAINPTLPALVFALSLTYVMLFLGHSDCSLSRWLRARGDYSYGVYIWGFPLQQLIAGYLPIEIRSPFGLFLVASPVVLGLAVLSWNFIERPSLGIAKQLFIHRKTVELQFK